MATSASTTMTITKTVSTGTPNTTNTTTATSSDGNNRPLAKLEQWNIGFLVLAWACNVASLTLVVGTGAIIVKSVGGSNSLAPFALGANFLGMSLISLTCTHWIFAAWGRRQGFLTGIYIGLFGVVLGCISIVIQSPTLVIITNLFLGAGSGMGMYLRFAAIEVVPSHYHSRAVTWVLSGGCLAAFAGPESAQAAKLLVPDYEYLGVFVVAGIFLLTQAMFIRLVEFPSKTGSTSKASSENKDKAAADELEHTVPKAEDVISTSRSSSNYTTQELLAVLSSREFIIPLLVATFSWAIMAMPMGLFRVAMKELGYTERQSLTVIEFHFLGMYVPGFFSGGFLKQHGTLKASIVSMTLFLVAILINAFATQDNSTTVVTWYLGLILVGNGWNFGFSAATLWITDSYTKKRNPMNGESLVHLKPQVQAANECGMFLMSGAAIFSTGYIFEAGGGRLAGWQVLNYTLLGLIATLGLTLLWAGVMATSPSEEENTTTTTTSPSTTVVVGNQPPEESLNVPELTNNSKRPPQTHDTTVTEPEQNPEDNGDNV